MAPYILSHVLQQIDWKDADISQRCSKNRIYVCRGHARRSKWKFHPSKKKMLLKCGILRLEIITHTMAIKCGFIFIHCVVLTLFHPMLTKPSPNPPIPSLPHPVHPTLTKPSYPSLYTPSLHSEILTKVQ